MRHEKGSRCIAVSLVFALVLAWIPAHAGASPAALSGRVVSAGSHAPLAGARVHVADPKASGIRSSGMTGTDGTFELSGLPPATYSLAVESKGGLYVVNAPVGLSAGEHRSLQLAVAAQAEEPKAEESEKAAKANAKVSVWNNPLTAALIVVGAAVVIGAVVGNATETTSASPSYP